MVIAVDKGWRTSNRFEGRGPQQGSNPCIKSAHRDAKVVEPPGICWGAQQRRVTDEGRCVAVVHTNTDGAVNF